MTDTGNATDTSTAAAPTARRLPSAAALLGIGVLLGAIVIFAGNYNVDPGENGGLGPAIFSAAVLVALTAILYWVVLPRVQNVDRTVIILSVIAIVTLVVFWLGITPVVAAAAIAAGAKTTALSKAALVLEVIAIVAAVLTVTVGFIG